MADDLRTYGIHHVKLTVTDMERTREFYTEVLGFEFLSELGNGIFLTNGSVGVGIGPSPDPNRADASDRFDENRVGLDHLSLAVADRAELERAVERLDQFNVPHGDIVDLGPDFGIYTLAFRDPDNIQLELTAPR